MRITIDQFNAELLAPAHSRHYAVQAEVKEAERELEALIRPRDFDEDAVEAAQLRLEALQRALARWGRRHHYLEGCVNVSDATGFVDVEA